MHDSDPWGIKVIDYAKTQYISRDHTNANDYQIELCHINVVDMEMNLRGICETMRLRSHNPPTLSSSNKRLRELNPIPLLLFLTSMYR